jgi:uroporphyrin-III C-methyltransferase
MRSRHLPSTGCACLSADSEADQPTDAQTDMPVGTVTLVGAGPGDPDLLTLKAVRALAQARLALYDHLVSPAVLDFLPTDAQRIYVGKEATRHTLPQTDIARLMVRLARAGQSLVRLKGGDGYIFGRGGEEVQALAEAGIPFRVIPGLTAAQGAAASTGIPLTHRDHAGTLVLATGHRRGDRELDMDWSMLARPRQTVVLYMGVSNLPEICRQLLAHGLSARTPAALIENATLPEERCVTGLLSQVPDLAKQHQIRPPALIVIGQVVAARQPPAREQALDESGLESVCLDACCKPRRCARCASRT